jgi:hypothetical protein
VEGAVEVGIYAGEMGLVKGLMHHHCCHRRHHQLHPLLQVEERAVPGGFAFGEGAIPWAWLGEGLGYQVGIG